LKTPISASPVVNFKVHAGVQLHPVWALDRLAVVIYCYCDKAREIGHVCGEDIIQLNLMGNLVSNEATSIVVATSAHWHTSKEVREAAEVMIAELTGKSGRFSARWPQEELVFPIQYSDVSSGNGHKREA